jgi:uncharacterized alpha-E superfamily protein
MLSRVADSLYWMSRYMERSDGILRMLKINYASSQDDLTEFSWKPVLKIFTLLDEKEANEIEHDSRVVLQYMVTDRENPGSVYNIVTRARENARSVQDHITKELWQCLNEFFHLVRDERLVDWLNKEDPISVLDVLTRQCLLFYGTADVTMARGEGNSFMNIGKYLERAIQSSDILDVKLSNRNYNLETADTTYWKYLLLSISGFEIYLKTFPGGFEPRNVVELIILNNQFPRSVLYSIVRMHRHFESFKTDKNIENFNKIDFLIGRIKSKVQYSTSDAIIQYDLHKYLMEIKSSLNEIGTAFNVNYFRYS